MSENTPEKKKRRMSMIVQVMIIFAIGVIFIGTITTFVLYTISKDNVRDQMVTRAQSMSKGIEGYINQYPAHDWLVRYWYDNYDKLDIEYDVTYDKDTETAKKSRMLTQRHPGFQPHYATIEDVKALPEADQKAYAEVVYSWLITYVNGIKADFGIDYLFCVVTEDPFKNQFFLFSANATDAKRGTGENDIYTIGKQVTVPADKQEAMTNASAGEPSISDEGNYMDYYYKLASFDDHYVLLGLTRNVEQVKFAVFNLTLNVSMLSVFFLVILAIVCLLMILLVILRPLRKVQDGIDLYKNTKDSSAVKESLSKINSRNELSDLSEAVADMTSEIDDYTEKLQTVTSERERMETELSLATRIQTAMLPTVFPPYPEREEFDIFASMDPAREVGGDFYDFFLVDDDHLALVIADVSGKGVPAALFMMASKISLQHFINTGDSPSKVFTEANDAISKNNTVEMFITVWLGILEISTGKLTASNAGHEYPIVFEPGKGFELIKDKHNFVIGGMEGLKYDEYEIQLVPGSKLFLYTDGVPEATDSEQNMFGMDRVLEVLNEDPDATTEQTLSKIKEAVGEFTHGAEQFDDLTMLCLTYNGPTLKG